MIEALAFTATVARYVMRCSVFSCVVLCCVVLCCVVLCCVVSSVLSFVQYIRGGKGVEIMGDVRAYITWQFCSSSSHRILHLNF